MIRGRKALSLLYGIVAVTALLCVESSAYAQIVDRKIWRQTFISRDYRPRWGDRYENFGSYDMRRYARPVLSADTYNGMGYLGTAYDIVDRGPVSPVSYDPFGNFLLPGGQIFQMTWNKSRLGTGLTQDSQWGNSVFNNLMIMSDEISNWQTRFMISNGGSGSGIRAYFTPSTLKITNFRGFRWDASTRKNNVTLLASPGSNNQYPLYGVHWQSKLGDILDLGASYVSRQRGTIAYSHQDIDQAISGEPQYLYIVITDDSPEDLKAGALVYGIKAFIDGREQPIAFKGENYPVKGNLIKIPNLLMTKRFYQTTATGKAFQNQFLFMQYMSHSGESSASKYYDYEHRDPSDLRNNPGSWFLDLFDQNTIEGKNLAHQLFDKSLDRNNFGLVNVLTEDVTGNTEDRYDPDVTDPLGNANVQYLRYFKADFSQTGYMEAQGSDVVMFEIMVPPGTRSAEFNVNVANDYCIDIIAPLYNRFQTRNPGFYDQPFSTAFTGGWSVEQYDERHCAKAPGNVTDASNQQWVRVRYNRLTGMDVYGMNMAMEWRGLSLRAEYNVSTTKWSYPVSYILSGGDRHNETSRAWFVNGEKQFGTMSAGFELFNYPQEYMQYNTGNWNFIEDNDDNDLYPGTDSLMGMDADYDRNIDTTWDGQPFLDYFYDSVAVGDDFNHNGSIDRRENDSTIDLPYDRDSSGQHYFVKYRPRESTIATIGHYDIRQEYFEGRNFTRYLKFEHHQRIRDIGEVLFYDRSERMKDNLLPNNLVNSWKTTNTLMTRLYFIPNTNIINNATFSTSRNVGDLRRLEGTYDEQILNFLQIYHNDRLINQFGGYSYTLEHKADYKLRVADFRLIPTIEIGGIRLLNEVRIREFELMPAIKVLHSYSYSQPTQYTLHEYDRKTRRFDIYPVVRFDYRVAPKTRLRFGVQGFPGFPEMHRVRTSAVSSLEDYDKRSMVFAFENQSLYEGFNIIAMVGVRFNKLTYLNDVSKISPEANEYFITIQSEAN